MKRWGFSLKLIAGSALGLILAIGLCSVGTPFEGRGTPWQDFAATVGLWLFLGSAVGLLVGIVSAIWRAILNSHVSESEDKK